MRALPSLVISVVFFLTALSSPAYAQEEPPPAQTRGTAIVGMGLLGGELVLSIGAVAGLRKPVWVLSTGALGLAGGIIGGIFYEKIQSPFARDLGSVSSLVLGMGGVIPTILILMQTRANDAEKPVQEAPSLSLAPPALLQLSEGRVEVGLPSLVPLLGQKGEISMGALLLSGEF